MPKKKTHEEYIADLKEKNPEFECLEQYQGNTVKILHKHLICGYEWRRTPKDMLRGHGCPKCNGKLARTNDEFKEILLKQHHGDFTLIEPYVKYDQKVKLKHKCGYIFETFPSTILVAKLGYGCPRCSKRHYFKKNGSLSENYPEFCKYLVNKDDGKKYGRYTEERLLLKCPDCGHTQYRQPNTVITHGFHCEICRDGISKNEKIMRSILSQLNIDFEVEKIFSWSDKKRYDFYFDNIICEMNGKQHYLDGFVIEGNKRTLKEEIENDNFKRSIAFEHGFDENNYLVIDCRKSDFQWIKEHILKSKLSQYYDLSVIDWRKCELDSMKSVAIIINDLWNSGKSVKEIVKELKLSNSTVTKYLTQFHELGMNSYDYVKERNSLDCRKVVCLNTKEIFNSIKNASKQYKVYNTSISDCCMKKRNSAGTYNGKKLVWAYYEDYIKYSDDEIQKLIENDNKNNKKVICLNTKQIFKNVTEATKYYGFKSKSSISTCCRGNAKSAGKDIKTGEKLKWMFYEDYLTSTDSSEVSA